MEKKSYPKNKISYKETQKNTKLDIFIIEEIKEEK